MTPAAFVDECRRRGVALRVSGDKLRAEGPPQPAPVVRYLAAHKAEIINLLTTPAVATPAPSPAPLVGQVRAGVPEIERIREPDADAFADDDTEEAFNARMQRLYLAARAGLLPRDLTSEHGDGWPPEDANRWVLATFEWVRGAARLHGQGSENYFRAIGDHLAGLEDLADRLDGWQQRGEVPNV